MSEQTTTEQKIYDVNGVQMPFEYEKLMKVLKIMKKVMANTFEKAMSSEEIEDVENLLDQIK